LFAFGFPISVAFLSPSMGNRLASTALIFGVVMPVNTLEHLCRHP
jgi:hypothetical protein